MESLHDPALRRVTGQLFYVVERYAPLFRHSHVAAFDDLRTTAAERAEADLYAVDCE